MMNAIKYRKTKYRKSKSRLTKKERGARAALKRLNTAIQRHRDVPKHMKVLVQIGVERAVRKLEKAA